MTNNSIENQALTNGMITPGDLLDHWQGHRRLTRKVIEAFPEDKLFNYAIAGMRPFSALAMEFINMAEPGMAGILTGNWTYEPGPAPATKQELLIRWDAVTAMIKETWPRIPLARFREKDVAFGQWEGPIHFFLSYWIDNEIHHRGQGYVYLRSLGIEPPAFWDRE